MASDARAWKSETKFYMANERTLMAWFRVATTIGIGALVAGLASGNDKTVHIGREWSLAQIVLSILVVVYALVMYHRRNLMVRSRFMGSFEESFGPGVAALTLAGVLAFNLIHLIHEPAVGCLELPLPIWRNVTPPFFYISFHGTGHLRRDCNTGSGGIHRFTLDGRYAGLATDQLAAQVLHPRGMIEQEGMLFVAESWFKDSSVVAFGSCAGTSSRLYLGRIRPDSNTLNSFSHPYGLASKGDSWLRLSTQDGGAVIAIDIHSNRMFVEHQVEPYKAHNKNSGPLRGIAIDEFGCKHVADKRADRIYHYCPGVDAATYTHLIKPIALYYDSTSTMLFVTSLHADGKIFSYSLKDAAAMKGSLEVARTYADDKRSHFTGMHVLDGTLYVLEQVRKALVTFDVESAQLTNVILQDLPDAPEDLIYVQEC